MSILLFPLQAISVLRAVLEFNLELMPIEIKELQIKAAVGNSAANSPDTNPKTADLDKIRRELVREVTEEVLRIIQLKLER